jgi:Flp pilus assembly protein TadD
MAHRGLRKPSTRRSLRPRNHSSIPPRTAADGTLHSPLRKVTQSEQLRSSQAPHPSDPAYDEPLEHEQFDVPAAATEREVSASGDVRVATHDAPAEAHIDREDPLMDAFFRHPDKPVIDVWEETHPPRAMSRGSQRAMYASIGIFAVSVICIGGYAAYHTLIMPAPVELGATSSEQTPAQLPTPLTAAPAPETSAPAQARPAETETQLSAAREPATPAAPPVPTLAALAAREPSPEERAAAAPLDGVVGAHLLAVAAAERDTPARTAARSPAAAAAAEAEDQAEEPMPPIKPGARSPAAPTYDELVAVGHALSKKNRRIEASEAFRRALLHAPQGSAALSGLSYVYLNADQNQQAREYAQRAVQADATNAEGWIVLGAALELLGDKAGAQDAYRNCVAQGRGAYLPQCRQVARP